MGGELDSLIGVERRKADKERRVPTPEQLEEQLAREQRRITRVREENELIEAKLRKNKLADHLVLKRQFWMDCVVAMIPVSLSKDRLLASVDGVVDELCEEFDKRFKED